MAGDDGDDDDEHHWLNTYSDLHTPLWVLHALPINEVDVNNFIFTDKGTKREIKWFARGHKASKSNPWAYFLFHF